MSRIMDTPPGVPISLGKPNVFFFTDCCTYTSEEVRSMLNDAAQIIVQAVRQQLIEENEANSFY